MIACRICHQSEGNRTLVAREMMFGLREPYEYLECATCGCLQIVEVPGDLARHYPPDYYAFTAPAFGAPRFAGLKRFLKRRRLEHASGARNLVGNLLCRLRGKPAVPAWARIAGVRAQDAILDVGCGAGEQLLGLSDAGFVDLTGLDPFIEKDLLYPNGVRVWKKELSILEGAFDCITLHHSFEHLPNPHEILRQLARLCRPSGVIVIRIPLAGSFAWRTYRECWVQLDAPRHLFLHTLRSIERLAGEAVLRVERIEYDSTAFQFWGSEQYRRDIPLMDSRSYLKDRSTALFSTEQMAQFRAHAEQLNAAGEGDQAAFFLRRK